MAFQRLLDVRTRTEKVAFDNATVFKRFFADISHNGAYLTINEPSDSIILTTLFNTNLFSIRWLKLPGHRRVGKQRAFFGILGTDAII